MDKRLSPHKCLFIQDDISDGELTLYTEIVGVPVETAEEIIHQSMTAGRGRRWVIGSLVCAALSLAFAPGVFGPLGVVAGAVAVWKGARWWGTAGGLR